MTSVVDWREVETDLPRENAEQYWAQLAKEYCGGCEKRRRNVAQLILREVCGWTLEAIGVAHGQCKGRVCRQIRSAREGLRKLARSAAGEQPGSIPPPSKT